MKERIERATKVLIGKGLWNATRAADLASFQFGRRRELPDIYGNMKTVGEYSLHVQCAWRIPDEDRVIKWLLHSKVRLAKLRERFCWSAWPQGPQNEQPERPKHGQALARWVR